MTSPAGSSRSALTAATRQHAGQHRLGSRDRRDQRWGTALQQRRAPRPAPGPPASPPEPPVSLSDALAGINDHNATLVIQAVARAAGQTWLTSASMTYLAELLTVLDEFL